jgi:hypothetical protein
MDRTSPASRVGVDTEDLELDDTKIGHVRLELARRAERHEAAVVDHADRLAHRGPPRTDSAS